MSEVQERDSEANAADDEVESGATQRLLNVLFYSLLLVWGIVLYQNLAEWDAWKDSLLPSLILYPLLIMVVYKLGYYLYTIDTSSISLPAIENHGRTVFMVLWVATFPVAIYYLGFTLVVPAYFFGFVLYSYRDVPRAVVVTAIFAAFLYVLFNVILQIPLWEGEFSIGSLL